MLDGSILCWVVNIFVANHKCLEHGFHRVDWKLIEQVLAGTSQSFPCDPVKLIISIKGNHYSLLQASKSSSQ